MGLRGKLVGRALAAAVAVGEAPGYSVVERLNSLARGLQHCLQVGIRREDWRWNEQQQQGQQVDCSLKGTKGIVSSSGLWSPARAAVAKEDNEAARKGHSYIYILNPLDAYPG